jgi:hypothetical protein
LFPAPVPRPQILQIAICGLIIIIGFIVTFGFITIAQRQSLQRIYSKTSPAGCCDRPSKVSTTRDRCRLAWRDIVAGEHCGDRLHRGRDVADAPVGGKVNLTLRSRHGGRSHSMQSRMAVGSLASTSSTAFRVNAPDSSASNAAAASVALLREPGRRPAGLPDRPFSNGRPRACPGSLGNSTSDMVIPLVQPVAHSRRRGD